jgi:hypothetical protein
VRPRVAPCSRCCARHFRPRVRSPNSQWAENRLLAIVTGTPSDVVRCIYGGDS